MQAIVILVTCANTKQAKRIATNLVRNKLAACVTMIDTIESFFWWEGKVDRAKEVLLIIKTTRAKFNAVAKQVKSLHSYQVPEIIALPVTRGYQPYLDWINDSIRR